MSRTISRVRCPEPPKFRLRHSPTASSRHCALDGRPHVPHTMSIPTVTVSDSTLERLQTPLLVLPLTPAALKALVGDLATVDGLTRGALGRAIERRDFRASRDETLLLPGGEPGVQRVLVLGLVDAENDALTLALPSTTPPPPANT